MISESRPEISRTLTRREPHTLLQLLAGFALMTGSQLASYLPIAFFGDVDGLWSGRATHHVLTLVSMSCGALLSVLGLILIITYLSRRKAVEFARPGALGELGLGVLIGAGLVSIPVLILWALGMYSVTGVGVTPAMISALAIGIGPGFIEEVFSRGILLRLVERATGTWWALAISALIFGLGHLGNPNVPLIGAIAIGVEAGLLLGAAYVVTRRLWLTVGIHAAWNTVQGGVWSSPVSGMDQGPGLIHGTFSGPEILTGGAMGIEGSILALIVCLIAAALLLRTAVEREYVLRATNWPPRWGKQPESHSEIGRSPNAGDQRSDTV